MNRKIAIITYLRAYNYGSALQAYALNRFLTKEGNLVETIDYTTTSQQDIYAIFEPVKNILSLLRNIQSLLMLRKLKRHKQNFKSFVNEYIPVSKTKFSNTTELECLDTKYDYYICGSDQIWNVQCADFDPFYMLSFVANKKKCVAYAPSLGAGVNDKFLQDTFSKYIMQFKALSSREMEGANVIRSATDRDVTNVVDPVFLLSRNEWNTLQSKNTIKSDYILGYYIGDVEGMRDFADELRNEVGMPVVVIYKNIRDLKYSVINRYESGPIEFVDLIRNAYYVVTNSFHAVSFSLIFQKNFWAFVNFSSQDSRINNILRLVNLQHRIVTGQKITAIQKRSSICYENVDMSELQKAIDNSKDYLLNNIA